MLSDSLFGICRICGNFPNWTTSIEQCCPIVSPARLQESRVDPFDVLPFKSSQNVNALMYHCMLTFENPKLRTHLTSRVGVNTLANFPTSIHSKHCTNSIWLRAAVSSPVLFSVTLYASALHMAGLRSERESQESLFYKAFTVQHLNECLRDDQKALSDETIAAVFCLLLIVVCLFFHVCFMLCHVNSG